MKQKIMEIEEEINNKDEEIKNLKESAISDNEIFFNCRLVNRMANDKNGEIKEENNKLKNKLKLAEQKNKTMEETIEKKQDRNKESWSSHYF